MILKRALHLAKIPTKWWKLGNGCGGGGWALGDSGWCWGCFCDDGDGGDDGDGSCNTIKKNKLS